MFPMYPPSYTDCHLLLSGALRLCDILHLPLRSPRLRWGIDSLYLPKNTSTSAFMNRGALLE